MSIFRKTWDGILNLTKALSVLLLAAMTLVIVLAVFYRYVLYNPISWAEELSRYCMIWLAMFGATTALIQNEHVGISAFVNILPARLQVLVQRLGRLLIAVFLGVVFLYSIQHLISQQGQTSSALQIPMYLPYMAISAGALLMLLVAVRQLLGIDEIKSADEVVLEDLQLNEPAKAEKGKVTI